MEEMPYGEITAAMIAKRAGMARSLIFYYFADMEQLFHSVVRDLLDGVRSSFEANDLASAREDPTAWLRREVEIFLDFMQEHPQAMETIVGQGWQDEQDEHGTTMMDFTASRVRHAFDGPVEDDVLDAALHSWAYHCVDFAIRLRRNDVQPVRAVVVDVLVSQAETVFTTLEAARRVH